MWQIVGTGSHPTRRHEPTSRPCRDEQEKPEIIDSKIDLHQLLATSTNFIKSPAEVNAHRKVDLQDQSCTQDTRDKFNNLCKEYDDIISKGSGDIGKTLLIEMDIDTGDRPTYSTKAIHITPTTC